MRNWENKEEVWLPDREGPRWYALRTQLKREKLAALNLRQQVGIEVFCPMLRYKKTTRRGPKWWVEPLFPSYLLAEFDFVEQERLVRHTSGVSKILQFGRAVPEVPSAVVAELRVQWEEKTEGEDELLVERLVSPGEEVEIATGAFAGVQGQVVEVRSGKERVNLLLEFLGATREVEVSLYDLILEKRPRLGGL